MTERNKWKVYSPEFKLKVGLEILRCLKIINEIGQGFGVHRVQVSDWKKAIQEDSKRLLGIKRLRL